VNNLACENPVKLSLGFCMKFSHRFHRVAPSSGTVTLGLTKVLTRHDGGI